MPLEIIDPSTNEIMYLASVDVKFSGGHIGGGIYFSANHNPGPGGSSTALPQSWLDGEGELHSTTEIDFTLPEGEAPWNDYRGDINGDGNVDFVLAGFDISLQVGDALVSTGTFYDGPAVPMLIANDPNDLSGPVTITGYPSAGNSLNGQSGVLHATTGVLNPKGYTDQTVNGDAGGYFTIIDAAAVGGMSGGATYLEYDADDDGVTETYLIGAVSRVGEVDRPGPHDYFFTQSAAFSPHYADMAAAIEELEGDEARDADDFPRMVMLSAQSNGSKLTTVEGQFFHEDIFGGPNKDTLFGGGGDDRLFGGKKNDEIFGGDGDDFLDGGAKNDVLEGGAGADVFYFESGVGNDQIEDFEDGVDRIEFAEGIVEDDLVISTSGLDTVIDYGSGEIRLIGVDASMIDADDFIFG